MKTTTFCYGSLFRKYTAKYLEKVLSKECRHIEINFHTSCFTLQNSWDACEMYIEAIVQAFTYKCAWLVLTIEPRGKSSEFPRNFLIEKGPLIFEDSLEEKTRLAQFYFYDSGNFLPSYTSLKQEIDRRIEKFPDLSTYPTQKTQSAIGYPRIHLMIPNVEDLEVVLPFGVYCREFESAPNLFGQCLAPPRARAVGTLIGGKIWLNAFKNVFFDPVQRLLKGRQVAGFVEDQNTDSEIYELLDYFKPTKKEEVDVERTFDKLFEKMIDEEIAEAKACQEKESKFADQMASHYMLKHSSESPREVHEWKELIKNILQEYRFS